MSNDLDPVRFSRLKLFAKSAAHYQEGFTGDSTSLRKGRATHRYLLGDKGAVLLYEGRRAGKKWEAYRDAPEHAGCDILIESEFKDVDGMRKAIERHPRAVELLDGIREERIEWTVLGRPCAGTPDVVRLLGGGRKGVTELKTSKTAMPRRFKWLAQDMAYHAQIAWYADGVEKTMAYEPGPVTEQKIVVVESSPPYPVSILNVTDRKRRRGLQLSRGWLEQLLICESTGRFPGYIEEEEDWDDDDEGDGLVWDEEAA